MTQSPAKAARTISLLAMAAAAPACSSVDVTGPDPASVQIWLEVSGGFTGVAYTIVVDGATGLALGQACAAGCAFRPGSVLVPLSSTQLADLATSFTRAGVFAYHGEEFGEPCCDQFSYRLRYRQGGRESVLSGNTDAMPPDLAAAIGRVHALVQGRIPAIVALGSSPADWPADPLSLQRLTISGTRLELHVTYGGGCADHPIDLVAWNGFLESQPVRLGLAIAHDSRNDPCDALVFSTRTFDLTPVRDAFTAAYGAASGTVILLIRDPATGDDRIAELTF